MLQGRLLPGALHPPQHRWGSTGCRRAAGLRDEVRATTAQLAAQHPGGLWVPALGADGAPGAGEEELQAPGAVRAATPQPGWHRYREGKVYGTSMSSTAPICPTQP